MQQNNTFKIARLIKGLTQYDVSLKTSPRISPARLSLFERGYIGLRDEEIKNLQQVLEISDARDMFFGKMNADET